MFCCFVMGGTRVQSVCCFLLAVCVIAWDRLVLFLSSIVAMSRQTITYTVMTHSSKQPVFSSLLVRPHQTKYNVCPLPFTTEAGVTQGQHMHQVICALICCHLSPFLASWLSRKGPLDASKLLSIAISVARGMTYLHRREPPILHHDLKVNSQKRR